MLVCHGALDPHVSLADVAAQHGFTHARAKPGAIPGVAFHEQSDTRSFAAIRDFLARTFAS